MQTLMSAPAVHVRIQEVAMIWSMGTTAPVLRVTKGPIVRQVGFKIHYLVFGCIFIGGFGEMDENSHKSPLFTND